MKHTLFIFLFAASQACGMELQERHPEALRTIIDACVATARSFNNAHFATMADGTTETLVEMEDTPANKVQRTMFYLAQALRQHGRPWLARHFFSPDWVIHDVPNEGLKLVVKFSKTYDPDDLEPFFNDIMTELRAGAWKFLTTEDKGRVMVVKPWGHTFEYRYGFDHSLQEFELLRDIVQATDSLKDRAEVNALKGQESGKNYRSVLVCGKKSDVDAVVSLLGLKLKT